MRKILFTVLIAVVFASSVAAQFDPPVTDCVEEHKSEARAIYALEEAGCVLDFTVYEPRGDFWTAYGHLPASIGGKFTH